MMFLLTSDSPPVFLFGIPLSRLIHCTIPGCHDMSRGSFLSTRLARLIALQVACVKAHACRFAVHLSCITFTLKNFTPKFCSEICLPWRSLDEAGIAMFGSVAACASLRTLRVTEFLDSMVQCLLCRPYSLVTTFYFGFHVCGCETCHVLNHALMLNCISGDKLYV
jgi:hypothetical protein